MSSASKSVNIKFIQKMGTFSYLSSLRMGDPYQEYQKNGEVVIVILTSRSCSLSSTS